MQPEPAPADPSNGANDASVSKRPHSADMLMEESRDHWWNADFLELMARRVGIADCRRVLDVGCGRGHWIRSLSPILPAEAVITGVDREPAWVAEAEQLCRRAGLAGRCDFQLGAAEELPFDDASFDLATCQTVLIHVPDAKRALREMLRVLAPGGLLLLAEPTNLCQCLRWNSLAEEIFQEPDGVEELVRLVRFFLFSGKGKALLGEGSTWIGDLLPGFLSELGLDDIQVFQTDKAQALYPPYDSPLQRADVRDILRGIEAGLYIWREDEARRYFLAGGGTEAEFSEFWARAMGDDARLKDALLQKRFHTSGGFSFYLVSGRKPRN